MFSAYTAVLISYTKRLVLCREYVRVMVVVHCGIHQVLRKEDDVAYSICLSLHVVL
jgi:hypothetical protein